MKLKRSALTSLALLTLSLGLLSACGSAPTQPDRDGGGGSAQVPAPPRSSDFGEASARKGLDEPIAAGYELQLSSAEDENIRGKFRTDFDGKAKLPYNTTLKAAGLTVGQFQEQLASAYKPYFKSTPSIRVTITDRSFWVAVRGLVEKPGRYLVTENTTLDEVIALAGGLPKSSGGESRQVEPRYAKIEQAERSVTIKLSDYFSGSARSQVPRWQGGDSVFLQTDRDDSAPDAAGDAGYLQILGEVKNSGEYHFKRGADFYYYLSKAGGPTQNSDLRKIEVVRGSPTRRSSDTFSLGDAASVPTLKPGDIVIVHADKPTPFERGVGVTSSILTVVNSIMLLILLL